MPFMPRIPTPFPHLESRSPRPTRRPEHKGKQEGFRSYDLIHGLFFPFIIIIIIIVPLPRIIPVTPGEHVS
jgi:hypothetical protein